ncbi:hypothetical protein [Mesorhizobium sp. M0960]|uniref:hypothetical protein n=1 Tax=Mesorhizobium sp. M0960 TaxID=2957035 RepID=UPI00333CAF4F
MRPALKAFAAVLALLLDASCANLARADWRDDIGTFRIGISPSLAPATPFQVWRC